MFGEFLSPTPYGSWPEKNWDRDYTTIDFTTPYKGEHRLGIRLWNKGGQRELLIFIDTDGDGEITLEIDENFKRRGYDVDPDVVEPENYEIKERLKNIYGKGDEDQREYEWVYIPLTVSAGKKIRVLLMGDYWSYFGAYIAEISLERLKKN